MTGIKLLPKKILKKNESAIITFNERCRVRWIWDSEKDYDLCAFFKTKNGEEGGVFSNEYTGKKNDLGYLERFPFMTFTVDDQALLDLTPIFEEITISSLTEMEKVFFCIIGYTPALKNELTKFKGEFELISDTGLYFEIPTVTSKKGQVLVIARVDIDDNTLLLSSVQRVLGLGEAYNEIPGFNLICKT